MAINSHIAYLETFSSYLKVKEIEDNCTPTKSHSLECDVKHMPPLYDPTVLPSAIMGSLLIGAGATLLILTQKRHSLTRTLQFYL